MRVLRPLSLLLALALCACAGVTPRPTSLRELTDSDLKSCFSKAEAYGAGQLHGTLNLYMVVAADGAVPAAWIHDAQGLDFPPYRNCLTLVATDSKFESEKEGYLSAYTIECPQEAGACERKLVEVLPKSFDQKLAQDTLTFADWASGTDKGWGFYYTQQYPLAIAAFDAALKANPNDVSAMRGLAQASAESGGDLTAARALAEKAVAARPGAATLESLVRVCLQQKDDECVVKNFLAATKAEDKGARGFNLLALFAQAKAADARLGAAQEEKGAAAKQAEEAQLAKADPQGCYKLEGAAKAVCYTKRCFADGATAYAGELRKAAGQTYAAGEWTATGDDASGYTVTVPLRPEGAEAKHKKRRVKAAVDQDASWKVKITDRAMMVPLTRSAAVITTNGDACAAKQ